MTCSGWRLDRSPDLQSISIDCDVSIVTRVKCRCSYINRPFGKMAGSDGICSGSRFVWKCHFASVPYSAAFATTLHSSQEMCRFIFTNMIYCAGTYLMVLVFLSFGYAHDGAVQSSVQDHSYQRDSLFDQIKVNGSNPRFALLKSTDIVCLQITSPISQLRRSCNFTQFIEYNCN